MRLLRLPIAITILSLLLPACTPEFFEVIRETDEKQYQLAKNYQAQGRDDEALSAYLRVIDTRRDAPESHFEAGHIYLTKMKDPVSAIYHFKRYIQLKPDSVPATQVHQLIETARKEFARQLPARPYQGQLDQLDLMELIKGLKRENESLKRDLVAAQSSVQRMKKLVGSPQERSARSPENRPSLQTMPPVDPLSVRPIAAAVPLRYTVRSGDTLSRISVRIYGTPLRWIDIYQANRDRLSSENALRVGQELRIP